MVCAEGVRQKGHSLHPRRVDRAVGEARLGLVQRGGRSQARGVGHFAQLAWAGWNSSSRRWASKAATV